MSDHSTGQPAPTTDFKQVNQPHQQQDQEQGQLEHNPPEPVFDPERVLEPTPFGNVDRELLSELDHSEQQGIIEAQHQELELSDQFNYLRDHEFEPEEEIDELRHQVEQDNYEERLLERFNQLHQHDLEQDQ